MYGFRLGLGVVGVWVYGCMGVWVYGCMGVWVYGCVGVWVCGCMGVWVCGCMGVWVYGLGVGLVAASRATLEPTVVLNVHPAWLG